MPGWNDTRRTFKIAGALATRRMERRREPAGDDDGTKAALENVSVTRLPRVAPRGESERGVLDDSGERDVAGSDDEMDVIRHQAEGEDLVAEAGDPFLEEIDVASIVRGVGEDPLAAIAAMDHVVNHAGAVQPRGASHGANVGPPSGDVQRGESFGCPRGTTVSSPRNRLTG